MPETFNGYNNKKKSGSLPEAEKDAEFVKGLDQIVVSDIKKECIISEDKLLIESTECNLHGLSSDRPACTLLILVHE